MDDKKEYIKEAIKVLLSIVIVFFLLGLCSCTAKREVVNASFEKDSILNYYLSKVDKVSSNAQKSSHTRIIVYDTSLPINESTGKPPEKILIEKTDSVILNVEIHDTINVLVHDSIFVKSNECSTAYKISKKDIATLVIAFVIILFVLAIRVKDD